MINNDKKVFYGLNLYNYFAPSCYSSIKTYFGNLDEIRSFIGSLDNSDQFKKTKEAFKQYLDGNTDAIHYVAFNHHRLIETVELITKKDILIENTNWEFLNVWGWPHYMEIDSGTVKMVLLKKGKTYVRAIKASVRGLRTCNRATAPKEDWLELRGSLWGHPCLLVVSREDNNYVVNSTLYMKEKEYKTKKEALEKFHTEPVSLNCLCEDVFGDG